ncbi:alcohol dehydrogenase [Bacillus sp. FJAT-27231]|uniref:iron-containing alcohol dehydrogenase n=1 Tax=Bacillus sp. FJAT-27231 TaxID=1679168 RepID=UPI000670770D|nr:iron-containing alcohol dehydrogenase [Bacillus sp. FJAT-27231]KMY55781.1 alcohol dehydrogenase [Bacillus sp. FJAT-27231]
MPVLDLPRHIVIENGALERLDELVAAKGGSKVFVIMDSFLANPPVSLHERVADILVKQGFSCLVFSGYSGEPTTENVQVAVQQLRAFHADCVVAIGGGSAIDLAKAVAVFGENPNMQWSEVSQQQQLKRLPLIAVPTTAGTGSEATKIMVITDPDTNVKMNPSHPDLVPDAAVLDPELTFSLPPSFTVYTGLDALTHAIEGYVSTRASQMTDLFALEAIREIGVALPKVYENGKDSDSRRDMILASCYAGLAFSNASTNLAHAAGRPLGAQFHIPHGLSVALLLPFVMRFGLDACKERYADVALALGADSTLTTEQLAEQSIAMIEHYNEQFGIWKDASKYIEPEQLIKAIPSLVADALSGNGIATNRKIPAEQDIERIYRSLAEKVEEANKLKNEQTLLNN